MIATAILCSLCGGALQPLMFLFFGDMTNSFIDSAVVNSTEQLKAAQDQLLDDMKKFTTYFCGFGAGSFVLNYARFVCLFSAATRITGKIRNSLFGSLLRQEISWYDVNETGELNTRLTE